ncbi:hypothetical protein [Reichenbachiella versicolor]|uniref:hypothetical protein n=1 Tax=Reichenbachiella versicolor TaxID=1821036 RepID=UPI000D6EAA67|nr:hypothetical protein [Reichenbachiella versicolor]
MEGLKKCLTIAFCTLSLLVSGQEYETHAKGYVMSFGKVIPGDIEVNLEKNTVQIRKDGNISILHAKNVQKVSSFKNGNEEIYYTGSFGMSKTVIFRALSDGGLPLLYREGVKFSQYDDQEYPPYFIMKGNHIYSLGMSKKEIFEVFDGRFEKEMSDFVKENKINFKSDEGLTALFDHYNSITMMAAN